MDIVLVIDESGSMSDVMSDMIAFAKNLVDYFAPLGENGAKFAIVSFNSQATIRTPFSADSAVVHAALDVLSADGWTAISLGLRQAHAIFTTAGSGAAAGDVLGGGVDAVVADTACGQPVFTAGTGAHRPSASKILVKFSDGEQTCAASGFCSDDGDNSQLPIDEAQVLKDDGITIFAWGLGAVSQSTLEAIASDASKARYAPTIQGLEEYVRELRQDACSVKVSPMLPPAPPCLPPAVPADWPQGPPPPPSLPPPSLPPASLPPASLDAEKVPTSSDIFV